MVFYDSGLVGKLHEGTESVMLKSAFSLYAEHVAKCLSAPFSNRFYKGRTDRKLLELCLDHAKDHQRSFEGTNVLMLTHPFFLHLCLMNGVSEDVKTEADDYLTTLLKFLHYNREQKKVGIVVLETLHQYAAVSSILLEEGLVDRVVFTQHDSGDPLHPHELSEFRDHTIYFGGGFNGRCLESSIHNMRTYSFREQIWAVLELVINSPQDYEGTIKTTEIEGVDPLHVITIREFMQRLGLMFASDHRGYMIEDGKNLTFQTSPSASSKRSAEGTLRHPLRTSQSP